MKQAVGLKAKAYSSQAAFQEPGWLADICAPHIQQCSNAPVLQLPKNSVLRPLD